MKKFLLTFICCLALPAAAFAYNASDVQQVQSGISCSGADLSGADLSALTCAVPTLTARAWQIPI